jgi:5-methylcytosine-specific restriction endonuclease McrA
MPIRPDLKHFYGPEWRNSIRPRILARDRHRCAFCGKPNHADVWQIVDPGRRMWWIEKSFKNGAARRRLLNQDGKVVSANTGELPLRAGYLVRVVLTVAHLDHDPSNMEDYNLAALCQWCHLHHAATRATRKDRARPILQAAAQPAATEARHSAAPTNGQPHDQPAAGD